MKKNITVLYVEDDICQRKDRMFVLSARYLNIIEANNGQEGLDLYEKYSPNMIITDIVMPIMDGLTMVEHIRKTDKSIPILIFTSHVENSYLLQAVNWNNILFVGKKENESNTSFENILKNIENTLDDNIGGSIFEFSENTFFDMLNESLIISGHVIPLTPNEKKLLKLLCKNYLQVVSYETIYPVVWGRSRDDKLDSIRSLVRSVNRKLEEKYIINISGTGYQVTKK